MRADAHSDDAEILRVARVEARLAPHRWAWAEENRDRIEAHWRRRLAERPQMFDGQILLVSEAGPRDGGACYAATFFATRFSALLAFREWGFPDPSVMNAFATAAPRGTDGAFVLGVMGGHTAAAGQVYFPCGTPDLDDTRPDGTVDVEGSAFRELAEETGLGPGDYAADPHWTIVRRAGFLAFVRPVALKASAAAVRARILAHLAADPEPELAGIALASGEGDVDPARMPSYLVSYLNDAFAARPSAGPAAQR